MSLGIPTQIAVGALGMNADLDDDVEPGGVRSHGTNWEDLTIAPGENNAGGSRFVLRDGNEVQQPPVSGASTPIREREDQIACAYILLY